MKKYKNENENEEREKEEKRGCNIIHPTNGSLLVGQEKGRDVELTGSLQELRRGSLSSTRSKCVSAFLSQINIYNVTVH